MIAWLVDVTRSVFCWMYRCAIGTGTEEVKLLGSGSTASLTGPFMEAEKQEIRQNLKRLRLSLTRLGKTDFIDEFVNFASRMFEDPGSLRDGIMAWVNLLEILVQEGERLHGTGKGQGPYKKRHVKAAVLYVVRKMDIDCPRVPMVLEPLFLHVAVEPVVDGIVRLLNKHHLWETEVSTTVLGRLSTRLVRSPTGVLEWLRNFFSMLSWKIVSLLNPLSREMKAAVDAALQELPDSTRKVRLITSWIGEHAYNLSALVDLIAVATTEAERVLQSDGPRKQAYAREVVLALIEDASGPLDRSSLRFLLLESIIDICIDIIVFLFNKRNHPVFTCLPTARVS